MNRVTIVREDGTVLIDGIAYHGLDLSALPESVHAVQWKGDHGEVELVDAEGRATENRRIDSLADFQPALDAWQAAHEQAIRPPTLEELAARKLVAIEQALSTALTAGMPYVMPDGTEEVVQTRPEDEPNLLGLAIEARDLCDDGETGAVQQLRMLSNKVYELTPQQMIEVTDAAKLFKKQQLARSWQLKDQVRQTLSDETLSDDEKRAAIEVVAW